MRTTAELDGIIAHIDDTDGIAVLFAEQRGSAQFLRFFNGHFPHINGIPLQDGVLHNGINLGKLFLGQSGVVGEVEAQMIWFHQRTGLVDMITQHLGQSLLQQVRGRVGSHNGLAALHINGSLHNVIHLQRSLHHLAVMQILSALVLLDIVHLENALSHSDHTMVSNLAAHFCIERSLIQDNNAVLAAGNGTGDFIAHADSQHLCLALGGFIAQELGGSIVQAEINASPSQITQCLPGLPGKGLLLLHQLGKGLLIQGHIFIGHHFQSQVNREAVSVV